MSWRSDERNGNANGRKFLYRRLFRIVPMYYFAGILYFLIEPPSAGFNVWQLIPSMTFVNAWNPLWTPTVPGRWIVVPGGWSVGVEFTFYFCFPIIATMIRSMRSAVIFFVASLVLGCAVNTLMYPGLVNAFGSGATEEFLYFWFPHQLPIFALGTILYLAIEYLRGNPASLIAAFAMRSGYAIATAAGIVMVILAELLPPIRLSLDPPAFLPTLVLASFAFMAVALVVALRPANILVNPVICLFGKVSFSAYLLHFFVLHKLPIILPTVFDRSATGMSAIAACAALWVVALPLTLGLSFVTFRLVESPMIRFGRSVIERPVAPRLAASLT